ncbi:hypothetical protein Tco_0524621 [Tanacetum coccineum]
MLESIAYQTYYAYVTGEKAPKQKYDRKKAESDTSPKKKTIPATKGFRLKSSAKVAKTDKKKQPATIPKTKGLAVLSEVALTEAEQIKMATKKSKKDFHMSHPSGSGDGVDIQSKVPDEQQQKVTNTNEGAGVRPEVPDVPKDDSESEEESWTFSQDDDDAEEETDMNDDNDQEEEDEKADDEEVFSDQNTKDAHVTLTTEPLVVQQQSSSVSSDLVLKFINPSPDISIDSILNQNIQSHTLVNLPVSVAAETPSSDTTIPQQPIPNTLPLQQTPSSTITTTNPTTTLPKIPNFASVFQFDQRVSALETELSELKQTNQFVEVVSSISGIVDNYLASKMKEVVDVVVQLQSNKLREEAQAENQEFLNQVDSSMKAIIKEQVKAQVSKIMSKVKKYVTKSLGAEVLVRSTNQPQTSYAVEASLSEFKLKKILIDKMEENKSINRSDIQKNLYNALVESYNSNKDIISSYSNVVTLKRGRDDQVKDEDPSAGSNRGSKRRRSGKEVKSSKEPTHKETKSTSSSKGASKSQLKPSSKSAHAEEHGQKVDDLEDQPHQEFNTGNNDVTPEREARDDVVCQWNPSSSPTPDREWHKTKTVDNRPPQPWITQLVQAAGTQSLFNEFLATPIDFSAFIMNRLKIDNLTQEVLTGPTYDLIKGTCKNVVELEYHLEEVFKATNDQLDWHNPEGRSYPHDLRGSLSQRYTTSITKTKAVDYGQVNWIEDKVPRIWSLVRVDCDMHAY